MLDDNGIRPPVIAAGINLFGGPLGLIHRHVTGAIPIRRNTKDPAYLVTLKAYVAELLQRHDLFFYIEGGRSYSGELKTPKTGLLHAAMQADTETVDRADGRRLRHRARGSHPRAPGREAAAAPVRARDRRDGALRGRLSVARVRHLRHADRRSKAATRSRGATSWRSRIAIRETIGRLHKVLPTAVARRRDEAVDHAARSRSPRRSHHRSAPRRPAATWASRSDARRSRRRAEPLAARNIIHVERGGRSACASGRSCATTRGPPAPAGGPERAREPTDDRIASPRAFFHTLAGSRTLKQLASRYGMRTATASRAASSPARPSTKRSTPPGRSKRAA